MQRKGNEDLKFWKKFIWRRVGEKKKLNPKANEWDPTLNGSPVEEKSLFLTFSNGYPLGENQIFDFFTKIYGACVDKVYVHRRKVMDGESRTPMFGKVVFTTSAVPAAVLGGGSEKKLTVYGKQMRCKKYERHEAKSSFRQG